MHSVLFTDTNRSQTVSNACATVAMLNIVNNIPEIDPGEHLRQFKQFTHNFTPAQRGDAISNFDFIKQIHNSFARLVHMRLFWLEALENDG